MGKEVKREKFTFRRSFKDAISTLPEQEQLKVYDAILNYALDGVIPELHGIAIGYFSLIKTQIDTDILNQTNGKKGGRPRKPKEPTDDSPKKELDGVEFVTITENQFETVKVKYGEDVVLRTIQILDDWMAKGSKSARQYIGKNNYGFFRSDSWALQKALEELKPEKKSQPNWSV